MHRNPNVAYIFFGILVLLFVLFVLARRFPHIHWLQMFRFERPYDPARDRHLDTAWMKPVDRVRARRAAAEGQSRRGAAAEGQSWRDAPREVFAELREQYRAFRAAMPQLPPEQEARMRRRRDVYGGIKLILLGIALPFGYYALSVMTFFSEVSITENILVLAGSAFCIAIGITAIWRRGEE
jgi:hypothetical protein